MQDVLDILFRKDILAESSTAMAEEYVKYLDKEELLQPLQDDRSTETWGPGAGAILIVGKNLEERAGMKHLDG